MKLKLITLVAASVLVGFTGLIWLGFALLIIGCLTLYIKRCKWILWLNKRTTLKTAAYFSVIVLFAAIVRIFIGGIYNIPSESMQDALEPGDKILVSKLAYGPLVPFGNFISDLSHACDYATPSPSLPRKRLTGFSAIERGDIFVFTIPQKSNQAIIKRCIGLPGERIALINTQTQINQTFLPALGTERQHYEVWFKTTKPLAKVAKEYSHKINMFDFKPDGKSIRLYLNPLEKNKLVSSNLPDSISQIISIPDSVPHVYPWNSLFSKWSADNFGPIQIPYKGLTIKLDEYSFALYEETLENYEGITIRKIDSKFYCKNHEIKEYTFKQDYYFALGDNRINSFDSRFTGFIPKSNIEGKAVCILFSFNKASFDWARTFKLL